MIQNYQTSPIPQTCFMVGTFFAASYSKTALEEIPKYITHFYPWEFPICKIEAALEYAIFEMTPTNVRAVRWICGYGTLNFADLDQQNICGISMMLLITYLKMSQKIKIYTFCELCD